MQANRHRRDARIFLFARGAQAGEILIQDLVEPRRRRSLAGGTMHPHPVANEQMVERAVHRAEEGAIVGAEVCVIKAGCRIVQPAVGPFAVAASISNIGFI